MIDTLHKQNEVIQDLLAEVKRLRKGIKHVITYENTFLEGVPYIVKYLKSLIAEQER